MSPNRSSCSTPCQKKHGEREGGEDTV
uniref:Uncharacterized protein n=1 Tax=Anguilla anguilla TaxID=7936 RepID=A0A0E9U958_ANGAN